MGDLLTYQEAADRIEEHLVETGEYELSNAGESQFYVDIKGLGEHPVLNRSVMEIASRKVEDMEYDSMAGGGVGGAVTVPPLSSFTGDRYTVLRDEQKDYGTEKCWEGADPEGRDVLVVDDVITTGGSAIEMIRQLEDLGANPRDFLVYVDRQEGGMQNVADEGVDTHALFGREDILG